MDGEGMEKKEKKEKEEGGGVGTSVERLEEHRE